MGITVEILYQGTRRCGSDIIHDVINWHWNCLKTKFTINKSAYYHPILSVGRLPFNFPYLVKPFSFNEVYRRVYGREFSFQLAVKVISDLYIRRYTSQNENIEFGYPHSNALVTFFFQKVSENVVCCAYVQRLPPA